MSTLALFEEKHVRRAWNQADEKWYFSIDDVVEVLTDSANVKDYIKKLRKRDSALEAYWGTNCPLVAMPGADGKIRPIRASTTEIARKKDARGFPQNQTAAKAGGTVAGNARRDLEAKSGTRISTRTNFKELPEARIRALRKAKQSE